MGVGKLGDPKLMFVRKFRWTIEGEGFPEHFAKSVKVDLWNKLLSIQVYEVIDTGKEVDHTKWIERFYSESYPLTKPSLKLTTYDGCGTALYEYTFYGLAINSDTLEFDYADSDCSFRKIGLTFKSFRKQFVMQTENKPDFHWKLQVVNDKGTTPYYPVRLKDRPELEIEETLVTFHEGKMWIPGKSKWKALEIYFDRLQYAGLLEALQDQAKQVIVQLIDRNDSVCESWVLNNVWLCKLDTDDEKNSIIGLRFSDVNYLPANEKPR